MTLLGNSTYSRRVRVSTFPPTLEVGRFHLSAFGVRIKAGPLWIPDGLHLWCGEWGVHAFWHGSPYRRRVTFERYGPPPVIPDPPEPK